MPIELLTADAFRVAAKDGAPPECRILRAMSGEPEQDANNPDVFRFTCSDDSVDLASDLIKQTGWTNLKEFEAKNGVGLWAHDSSEPPIGRWKNMSVVANKLKGDLEFISGDIYPFAGMLAKMVRGGFLNAVSVGFAPIEWEFSKDKNRPFGLDFIKQILLEVSLCPVPCNQNALIDARSAGIDTTPLREWAEKILDKGGHILIPRNIVEEAFRQAKTPRTVRQKYLAKSEAADWKAGAIDDLPIADVDVWDGAAAAKRMLDDAGFDGDNPDFAKAARGFLIYDAANPVLRSSYKFPFADIVAGELKAIKSGVIAARSRIDQSDASAAVRNEAKEIADEYEQKVISSETIVALVEKSGRKISSANAALLQKAMDHHASATQCIKDVLDSNAAADPDGDDDKDPDDDTVPTVVVLSAQEQRVAQAKALRESIKL